MWSAAKRRKYRKAYYAAHREKAIATTVAWRQAHPQDVIRQDLKRFYNITPEFLLMLLVLQDYKCAICEKPIPKRPDQHVDHNHKTKQVRGVLCGNCNRAMGLFGDSAVRLTVAAAYLNGYEKIL
jgi:DNA-directed RNA polymerase subunit RPC12/RpoP